MNYPDDNREQVEKAKKNLVYVGIMSIVMLFAGFTSAYIVSMGDSFWVKTGLPQAFWISTGIIIASSVFIQMAVFFSKKDNQNGLKSMIAITFLLGLGFVYFQYKGYGQLAAKGSHFTGSGVVVTDGKYGEYYDVKQDGTFIEVDGNDFLKGGKMMSEKEIADYQNFMKQFLNVTPDKTFDVKDDGRHILYLRNKELKVVGNTLMINDSTGLKNTDRLRLSYLATHVKDKRGHFFHRGKIGKDFHIYFKGKELEYKEGNLLFEGQKLDGYLQIKANESPDTASSYLWIITGLHLLHIVVAMLFMLKLVISSFTGRLSSANNISLKMGAIFWHFLGILWVYLLLFLLFIH